MYPKLTAPAERPDIVAIGWLIALAWHQRQEHLQMLHRDVEKPLCVVRMEEELNFFVYGQRAAGTDLGGETDNCTFGALDFDMIDWSAWEQDWYVKVLD